MKVDHEAKRTRIAFGSKKLFNAQFHLKENGHSSHQAWLDDWKQARSSEIYIVGSGDETAGCQLCVATVDGVNSLSLRIRLPDCLNSYGKYAKVQNVVFNYGFDNIAASLQSGTALTYRFKRDEKGWMVFVATDVKAPTLVSMENIGAIGVDFNADHLAVAVANRHGNLTEYRRVNSLTVGKTAHQRAAILGDAVKFIVSMAVDRSMPIVIEKLDFTKKKAELETIDVKRSRILSALAYRQFQSMLKASAFRAGILIMEVTPAYTSTIGAVNYAARFGVSVHIAAAFAIARRGLRFSEKPVAGYKASHDNSQKIAVAPSGNGGHVTLQIPERKFGKHVWSQWQAIRRNLIAAHKGHFRSGKNKANPARLASVMMLIGAIRNSRAEPLGASCPHCSDSDFLSDVPW